MTDVSVRISRLGIPEVEEYARLCLGGEGCPEKVYDAAIAALIRRVEFLTNQLADAAAALDVTNQPSGDGESTTWPEAVREWDKAASTWRPVGEVDPTHLSVLCEKADAAIEALKDMVYRREVALEEVEAERDSLWKLVLHASKVAPEDVSARLLLALAEVERLRWMLRDMARQVVWGDDRPYFDEDDAIKSVAAHYEEEHGRSGDFETEEEEPPGSEDTGITPPHNIKERE